MAVVPFTHWDGNDVAADPVLDDGEIAIDTSTGAIKVGDGTTAFSSLATINASA